MRAVPQTSGLCFGDRSSGCQKLTRDTEAETKTGPFIGTCTQCQPWPLVPPTHTLYLFF